ncbi:MAG: hypothetical protein JW932_07055 [Deltaproteobacteria bacterium]|nr:hypothetical protein [Deltaproteobacteria bacterium]
MYGKRKIKRAYKNLIKIGLFFILLLNGHIIAAGAGAKIEVDKSIFDFNEIDEGPPAVAYAHLKNTGDFDVTIEEVIST